MQTERGNVFANRRRTAFLRLSRSSSTSLRLKLLEAYLRALVRSRVQVREIVGVLASVVGVVLVVMVVVVIVGVVVVFVVVIVVVVVSAFVVIVSVVVVVVAFVVVVDFVVVIVIFWGGCSYCCGYYCCSGCTFTCAKRRWYFWLTSCFLVLSAGLHKKSC